MLHVYESEEQQEIQADESRRAAIESSESFEHEMAVYEFNRALKDIADRFGLKAADKAVADAQQYLSDRWCAEQRERTRKAVEQFQRNLTAWVMGDVH